jgi:hypothetical protein
MSTLRVNTIGNLSSVGSANQVFYRDSSNIVSGTNNFVFKNPGLDVYYDANNYVTMANDGGQIEICRATPQGGATLEPNSPYIDFKNSPEKDWDWRLMAKLDGTNNYFTIRRGSTADAECLKVGYDGFVQSGGTNFGGWRGRAGTAGATSNVFNINWTGTAQLWIDSTNVGTISLSSDYRIKKNIQTQTSPAIERISKLRPITYELKNYGQLFKEDGVQREGFIAHELADVIPSAVEGKKDDSNQIQSLRLDALVSVLTKALQEAVTRIETLEAEVAALKIK